MPVLKNISLLACCRLEGRQCDIHAIERAALAWDEGKIAWVGVEEELPDRFVEWPSLDAEGRLVIPGLIDCHTHLAFGGWRAGEFEQRIGGKSYLEIAQAGGGILSTVRATRQLSEEALLERSLKFLREIGQLGVTTVECKSGYGLDTENEMKLLRAYRQLADMQPLRIVPTFLGAHVVAPEYQDRREGYIDLLIQEMIPQLGAQGLAGFCDVFLEESAFSWQESKRILEAGKRHGLRPKLHADQLSDSGGAELAAQLEAASADHLECISDSGIQRMADSGVVAVSLPFASIYLNQQHMPARRLIEAGVPLAVATDFNPGSAPSYDLPLALMLACNLQRMTPAEALKGATVYAARALGLEDVTGSLEPGKSADFAILDAPDVNHWMYHFRPNCCVGTYVGGKLLND
ncbi:MAG: imidazolonepropionase [Acidobacteriota bacterium]